VGRVLLAPPAKLLELKLVGGGPLVLGRGVVAILADRALQTDDCSISHRATSTEKGGGDASPPLHSTQNCCNDIRFDDARQ